MKDFGTVVILLSLLINSLGVYSGYKFNQRVQRKEDKKTDEQKLGLSSKEELQLYNELKPEYQQENQMVNLRQLKRKERK